MEPRGGVGESSWGRAGATPTPAPRAKRKKVKPAVPASGSQPLPNRPIPQPYLARAPKPISSFSSASIDRQPTSSNLVLPSSYRRPTNGDAGPSTTRVRERERYANGLLAPPAIRAGSSARNRPVSPNIAAAGAPSGNARRRQTDRVVRGLGAGNPSMTSLGHLGRIMETDPTVAPVAEERSGEQVQPANPPTARRRRRIVRGDDSPGVARRLTVSSREEGRAIGLARGASMRRLNVWDDLPENTDAPPPFPFPTTSTARLPPTFQTTESTQPPPPVPSSPPPTFEQATGLAPLPIPERPESRASNTTRYMSAPSSPVLTALDSVDEPNADVSEEERSDRRMWNADLLAGYTLEERVQREINRRRMRSAADTVADPVRTPITPPDPVALSGVESTSTGATLPAATVPAAISGTETPVAEVGTPVTAEGDQPPSRGAPPIVKIPDEAPAVAEDDSPPSRGESVSISTGVIALAGDAARLSLTERRESPTRLTRLEVGDSADEVGASATLLPHTSGEDALNSAVAIEQSGQPASPDLLKSDADASDESLPPVPVKIDVEALVLPVEVDDRELPTSSNTAEVVKSTTALSPQLETTKQTSNSSLPTLSETAETPTPTGETDPISGNTDAGPSRKLTRGKAIRRSSSGLIKASQSPVATAPLFSAARFDFGKFATANANPSSPPIEAPRPFIHRSSAREVPRPKSRTARLSEERALALTGGRRLGDAPAPAAAATDVKNESDGKAVIPPHRQAALLRRESMLAQRSRVAPAPAASAPVTITRYSTGTTPTSPRMSDKRAALPSGPLIDFSEESTPYVPSSSPGSSQGFQALASSNIELLQLLEEEAEQPESSSQAAAKAALVEDIRAQLADTGTPNRRTTPPERPSRSPPALPARPAEEPTELQETIKKKKAPPPPPPLRNRKGGAWTAGQKISIVDTATSPITPRPSLRRPANPPPVQISPTATASARPPPPPLPTRRPPPPPPDDSDRTSSPSHTSSPPPTLFTRGDRPVSAYSGTSETSSIFDKPQPVPPVPPIQWKRFDRSPYRPRGPRPRPPPPPPRPRTWAKVVSGSSDADQSRPPVERMHSAEELHDLEDRDSSLTVRSPTRSISERDLSLSARRATPRSPEYTDLDVFISRLEGSGREYEGYSHIAQFLGPAKSPAASQDALNTLLPGPVIVESRRTTKDGKVKLKLSLLGVRVTKCPICLAQFREKEMGVLLPVCGHLGHEECARRWFREDDRCFVCRVKLKAEEGVV